MNSFTTKKKKNRFSQNVLHMSPRTQKRKAHSFTQNVHGLTRHRLVKLFHNSWIDNVHQPKKKALEITLHVLHKSPMNLLATQESR